MFKKIFVLLPGVILALAIVLSPVQVSALALVPKGMVPNPPPLQPHSPLVVPDISGNINSQITTPTAESGVASSTAAPSSSPAVAPSVQQPNQAPPDAVNPESGPWGTAWLWLAFLLIGGALGYWLIKKDRGGGPHF